MEDKVQAIINTYSIYATIPSPSSAFLLPSVDKDSYLIHSTWTTRDLRRSELTKFSRNHVVHIKGEKISSIPVNVPQDSSSECLQAFSQSGKKKAILRDVDEKGVISRYLEIWNNNKKIKTHAVKNTSVHGKIYDDCRFGSLCWSKNEESLLYVAEEKQPKHESFFESTFLDVDDSHSDNEVTRGKESLFSEDWGESFIGKHHSIICIMNIQTGHVKVVPTPEDVSAGQALFSGDDSGVVYVGWFENPRRLGITYCTNRRSGIFFTDVTTGVSCLLSNDSGSVWSPRFTNDYNSIIYLENEALGPHHKCSKIMQYDFKTKKISVVVDVIKDASDDKFAGIFSDKLPLRCFSKDGKYIILSTTWRSKEKIICIDITSGQVQQIAIDESIGDVDVMDVKDNLILASASSPNIEPFLMIGEFSCVENTVVVNWKNLDMGTPCTIPGFSWSIFSLKPPPENENEEYPGIDYEAILLLPKHLDKHIPLIVWPHGGPHSVFTARYQLFSTVFAKLGFGVCMVNYRGSIGFGENGVNSLPGRIGVQDVKDVQLAAETVKSRNDITISHIILFGGSHGGFLAAHLSHLYPEFYKVCICRNPVINISSMLESTDIPDWSWTESGHKFMFSTVPVPELLKDMWEKSPISSIEKASIPTLILLGKKDRRVPSSQGMNYFHLLRANNVPVRLHVYDDNHSLSKVGVEADCFVQIMQWLLGHLS